MLKEDIINENLWNKFLEYKTSKDFVTKKEKKLIESFIKEKKYLDIANKISQNKYEFSIPQKHIISKNRSAKKRIVYTFKEDEMIILKFISFILYEYDYLFSPNLYSFRTSCGVKDAIHNLSKIKNLQKMYGYKVDISNYFNSINTTLLLKNLRKDIKDDTLYDLFKQILSSNKATYNKEIIKEKKGVLAGVPTSAFLANYYIKEIDKYFWEQNVVYLRYADDIILFCNTKEELDKNASILKGFIKKYKLLVNEQKEYYYIPNEKWEFLGFSFDGKTIDLSSNSKYKIKAKIKRSSKSIRRWMKRKQADYTSALKAMNRKYNKKFYGKQEKSELSWRYWFFPTITTDKSLKEIDNYMQQEQRYIVTGKHNKTNYKKVPYELLQKCNYKPLVTEYYKSKMT